MKIAVSGSLVVLLALAAQPAAAADPTAKYMCDDGTHVVAVFHNDPNGGMGSVALKFPDGMKTILPQAMSADGGRYAAGKTEFWIKGKQASFTRGESKTTCRTP
jgi:membrane-bound inhibitor of C-type lysozyme